VKLTTEFVTVLVGAVAAGLSLATLLVVVYQTALMKRQTEIIEKQDEIIARRAILSIQKGQYYTAAPENDRLPLMAHNSGRKGSDSFNWHILIPKEAATDGMNGGTLVGDVVVAGTMYAHIFGRTVVSLYPQEDAMQLSEVRIKRAAGRQTKFTILWYIAAHDGRFPEGPAGSQEYGRIEVDLRPLSTPTPSPARP